MIVPVLSITLGTGGCLVTSSTYEARTREADSLRDALASANKEKNLIEERFSTIQKQLAEEKEANAALASRNREQMDELKRSMGELDAVIRNYEGTRISREELISELLEKEKATGKRIQELSEMAQACEMERERFRKENAALESALVEREAQTGETPDMESLRRERDILLGRIERIKEEHAQEAGRRDLRFAELVKTIAGLSSSIAASPAGPAIRILVPDKVLYRKGKSTLTDTGMKVLGELGKTASEFPSATVIISADGESQTDEIRAVMVKGHALPPGQVWAHAGNKTRETELLLVIP